MAFVHTHKTDKIQQPQLYRQNKTTHQSWRTCLLLSDDAEQSSATTANLPMNKDLLDALSGQVQLPPLLVMILR